MAGKSGFSLSEILVTTAVAGLLMVIVVPSVASYRARARQAEAKSMATSLFVALQAFKTMSGTYHAYLPTVGFFVEGYDTNSSAGIVLRSSRRAYAIALESNPLPQSLANIPVSLASLGLTAPPPFNDAAFNWRGWGATSGICHSASLPTFSESRWALYQAANPALCPRMSRDQFCAIIYGCPKSNIRGFAPQPFHADHDVWVIRENSTISNVQSGI